MLSLPPSLQHACVLCSVTHRPCRCRCCIDCATAAAAAAGGSGDCSPVTLLYASTPFTLLPGAGPGPGPVPDAAPAGSGLGPYIRAALYASLAALGVTAALLCVWARKQGWRWWWAEDAAARY